MADCQKKQWDSGWNILCFHQKWELTTKIFGGFTMAKDFCFRGSGQKTVPKKRWRRETILVASVNDDSFLAYTAVNDDILPWEPTTFIFRGYNP